MQLIITNEIHTLFAPAIAFFRNLPPDTSSSMDKAVPTAECAMGVGVQLLDRLDYGHPPHRGALCSPWKEPAVLTGEDLQNTPTHENSSQHVG